MYLILTSDPSMIYYDGKKPRILSESEVENKASDLPDNMKALLKFARDRLEGV
jgi:hypothetical protein